MELVHSPFRIKTATVGQIPRWAAQPSAIICRAASRWYLLEEISGFLEETVSLNKDSLENKAKTTSGENVFKVLSLDSEQGTENSLYF